MTHDAYLQYKTLCTQYKSLTELKDKITEAIPAQLGESTYGYNRALTAQIRKDLFDVIEKHKTNLNNLMEDL